MARTPAPRRRILDPLAEFLREESASACALVGAAIVAMVWINSPWQQSYIDLWHRGLSIGVGDAYIELDLREWVNDGLMSLFFFVVGLEIKRELTVGELRDRKTAVLPAVAAVGGMLVPALCFLAINAGSATARGWGIPMATDIACSVGLLALLGSAVPPPLRLFLLTLAIVDDIGAILVIALFYGEGIEPAWLLGALACLLAMIALRVAHVRHPALYAVPALALWIVVFESGVHATIAGVVLGFLVPTTEPAGSAAGSTPLERLERGVHPLVSFGIVPLFALANAGVAISSEMVTGALRSRVAWGIVAGLVVGKLVGITLATRLTTRFGAGRLPPGLRPAHIRSVGAVAGIGFTVSLFVAELAFGGTAHLDEARLAILVASILSALTGAAMLRSVEPS